MKLGLVLLFIVIIAIIVLVGDPVVIIAIITGLLLMTRGENNVFGITVGKSQPKVEPIVSKPIPTPVIPVEQPQVAAPSTEVNLDLYGQFYEKWNQQRRAYTDSHCEPKARIGVSCAERNYDVDAANTLIWQKRTHDKQRSDGWAAKSSDYFAYHYADELDLEENKRWWGRDEF